MIGCRQGRGCLVGAGGNDSGVISVNTGQVFFVGRGGVTPGTGGDAQALVPAVALDRTAGAATGGTPGFVILYLGTG